MGTVLSHEMAMEIAEGMRGPLKIQNEISFGDMNIVPPGIDCYPDQEQFFDPQAHEIHIGAYGIVDMFHVETEEAFVSALNYIRGHEDQHFRRTA